MSSMQRRGERTSSRRPHSCPSHHDRRTRVADVVITELIYELLDAHTDTAELAADLVADPSWDEHLDYLRALQRVGRAVLARVDDQAA